VQRQQISILAKGRIGEKWLGPGFVPLGTTGNNFKFAISKQCVSNSYLESIPLCLLHDTNHTMPIHVTISRKHPHVIRPAVAELLPEHLKKVVIGSPDLELYFLTMIELCIAGTGYRKSRFAVCIPPTLRAAIPFPYEGSTLAFRH
jgi:hypothetical protein